MIISLDNLANTIPLISLAHSKQYFADSDILKDIGFASLLSSDVYIDTSFEVLSSTNVKISWALVTTFTKDNTIDDTFVCYDIPLPQRYNTTDPVKILLNQEKFWFISTIWYFIKGIPWIPFIIFNALLIITPALLESALLIINLIALIVVWLYYMWSVIRYIIRYAQSTTTKIKWQIINYKDPLDIDIFNRWEIDALIPLYQVWVTSAVFQNWHIYLKQNILQKDIINIVKKLSNWWQETWWEQSEIVWQTLIYLMSNEFTSILFSSENNNVS